MGDIDEDGKPDVVTAVSFTNFAGPQRVNVLFGNGDGTLSPASKLEVSGVRPQCVALADMNHDDHLDVVVVKPWTSGPLTGEVGVFLGDGHGAFGNEIKSPTSATNNGVDFALADLNGDGNLDVAVAAGVTTDNSVQVLLGNGDGAFGTGTYYASGTNVAKVAVGDFDGDGAPDLATANVNSSNVGILFNNGGNTGAFQDAKLILPLPGGLRAPKGIVARDLNNDGRVDVAVAFGSGQFSTAVVVALGNGDGSFLNPVVTPLPSLASPSHLIAVDLNGDKVLDLVTADLALSDMQVLIGKGDGTYLAPVGYPGGYGVTALDAADMDGDGRTDVVVGNNFSNDLLVSFGDGAGHLSVGPPSYPTKGNVSVTLDADDFTGDSVKDLVVANRNSSNLSIFIGKPDGTFQDAQLLPTSKFPTDVALGHFNADAPVDLAVPSEDDNNILPMLGTGAGTFTAQTPIPIGQGTFTRFIATGRFNNDAFDDLAMTSGYFQGFVSVFLGKGDGTFQTPVYYTTSPYSSYLRTFDVDGDGKLDLLVGSKDLPVGVVEVLYGDGAGVFGAPARLSTFGFATEIESYDVADLDKDGKPDLVIGIGFSDAAFEKRDGDYYGGIFIHYGEGARAFSPLAFLQPGTDPAQARVVDLDNDGNLDVVMTGGATREVSVFLGLGNRTFLDEQRYSMNQPLVGLADRGSRFVVYDINNDGAKDIVATFGALNNVETLLQKP